MIITIICDVLGEENNGTTIACMNLIRALKKRGETVRVVCSDKDKEGLEGYYIVPQFNFGSIGNYIVKKNGVALSKPDRDVLTEAIRDCDLVHTTFVFALSQEAIQIAREFRKPVTSSFHCQAENITAHLGLKNVTFANRAVYIEYYRHIYSFSDCIHYPTEFIRDVFENTVHEKTNCRVISNGVNDAFTRKAVPKPEALKDKFVILTTGRLSSEKNQDLLVRAAAVSANRDHLHIIIAGEGPLRARLLRLAKRKHVSLQIDFFNRGDIINIINYADLYVHCAEIEIESIACLEAICCGKVPVIADSKRSATRYFALDHNSLFRNKDYHDLAAKIDWWIAHPCEMKRYSAMYEQDAGKFDQEHCMDEMEKMMIDTFRSFHASDNVSSQP
jgi:1,2-diacylglycerol 3-alpha-glucosyltransferase